jgi:hypothetical protein
MAQPSTFINTSRSRISAWLDRMGDMVTLYNEYQALGAQNFVPPDGDPFWSGYDLDRLEVLQMFDALNEMLQAFNGDALAANPNRESALYKARA